MGYVYLYTGDAKGKTTVALGLALRSIGHGRKVLLVQFLKSNPTGEAMFTHPLLRVRQFGNNGIKSISEFTDADRKKVEEGLEYIMKSLTEDRPDLLIMDEINLAVAAGLVPESRILDFVTVTRSRYPDMDVVLTGRYATRGLVEISDFVNEIVEIKAPVNASTICDRGIQW